MPKTKNGSAVLADLELLRRSTCAELADVHTRTIDLWIRTRGLPAVKLGRSVRIRRSDFEQFIEARTA